MILPKLWIVGGFAKIGGPWWPSGGVHRRLEASVTARPDTTSALIDLPAVAERLGVNERHVRRLVAERRIPFLKWGHLLRFDPDEIDRWLELARRGSWSA